MSTDLIDSVLLKTDFPDLKLHASGKVRDVYKIGDQQLLFVASDRISAFDYVLATGIPHKGSVLNQMSLFWFDFLADIVPNHLITSNVDNDAGGISVYTQAGAQYGYALLWSLVPMTIALYVTEEMCARMGVVTGKGLSDLIREEFGFRPTFFVMITGFFVDLANVVAEFAGVAAAMQIFHVSKYIAVPVAAIIVWILVLRGTYRQVEVIFLFALFVPSE